MKKCAVESLMFSVLKTNQVITIYKLLCDLQIFSEDQFHLFLNELSDIDINVYSLISFLHASVHPGKHNPHQVRMLLAI